MMLIVLVLGPGFGVFGGGRVALVRDVISAVPSEFFASASSESLAPERLEEYCPVSFKQRSPWRIDSETRGLRLKEQPADAVHRCSPEVPHGKG